MADAVLNFYQPNDFVAPELTMEYNPASTGGSYPSSPATPRFYSTSQVANQVWNTGGYWSQISTTPDLLNSTKAYSDSLANTFAYDVNSGDMYGAQAALNQLKAIAANPYAYRASNLATYPSALGLTPFDTSAGQSVDPEQALLAEYNRATANSTPYSGPNYTPSNFGTGANTQSAYDLWVSEQQSSYNRAKTAYDDYMKSVPVAEEAAGTPKPFMPNGPPDAPVAWPEPWKTPTYEAELMQLLHDPKLEPYSKPVSQWDKDKSGFRFNGLDNLLGDLLFGGNQKAPPAAKLFGSPEFSGSGLLAQTMAKGMEGSDPQRNSSNPWQSKNLIKPASYFDESSQGIAPPKGLMGQDMITQNNVLPALQMALMGGQDNMPKGNEALDAATKPLNEAQSKGNATDKIQEARDKWKSKSLSKLANWQSLA